ncbi:MAG: Holliday junction resolvase RuvX [Proteobacteria bacterium]|nr:Holliday junction resolvase RuvX [Pseudomonadota bacterium]
MNTRKPADLAALLQPDHRLLGIDPGEKSLGLALSDGSRTIATPLRVLPRTTFAAVAAELAALARAENLGGIVVGLPLNMDGSAGPSAQSARALAANLERELGLPTLLWDERLSTAAVTRTLLDANASRKRRAGAVDKLAAAYILQGLLDRLRAEA